MSEHPVAEHPSDQPPTAEHPTAEHPTAEHPTTEPTVVERQPQPYVGVRERVTMASIGAVADRMPDVVTWVLDQGLEIAGPPFLRYLVIDMERELEIEAGVPLTRPAEPAGDIRPGVLPGGRYVVMAHRGHPDGLVRVTGDLLAWAAARGLRWDVEPSPEGERWGCRVESYPTDPRVEPDPSRWTTELAFRLADDDA
jgi:effector-binding domain-containing protein